MSHKCQSILRDRAGRLTAHVATISADLADGHFIIEHFHPEDQLKAAHSVPLQLPHPADPRGMRVARALQANPAERGTLLRLSKGSGASKRTIERIFLAETKMTFRQWRQQLRLLHALQLLAAGE